MRSGSKITLPGTRRDNDRATVVLPIPKAPLIRITISPDDTANVSVTDLARGYRIFSRREKGCDQLSWRMTHLLAGAMRHAYSNRPAGAQRRMYVSSEIWFSVVCLLIRVALHLGVGGLAAGPCQNATPDPAGA